MIVAWVIGVTVLIFLAFYTAKFIWFIGISFKRKNNGKK